MKAHEPAPGPTEGVADEHSYPACKPTASLPRQVPEDQLRFHLEAVKSLAADPSQLEAIKTHIKVGTVPKLRPVPSTVLLLSTMSVLLCVAWSWALFG